MIDPISAIAAVSKEVLAEKLNAVNETLIKESPLSLSLETIESTNLEALQARNANELDLIKKNEINPLKVPYRDISIQRNGEAEKLNVPDFDGHKAADIILQKDLYIAPDKKQFIEATKGVKREYDKNPEKVISKLTEQNDNIIKNDKKIFEANKGPILNAQHEMIEAKKNNDFEGIDKFHKKLRQLTNGMVNIQTPKGMPFIVYTKAEMLEKQIKDITNPTSSTQGRIYGFQWHHSEKPGEMQLVTKNVHESNPHKCGNYIWGKGVR